jgi:HD-GYP domain-containing protein (c-di-GMP phosphodiesterase class II)
MSFSESGLLTDVERTRRNRVIRELLERLEIHAAGEKPHAERVAVYSVATGEQLDMSEDDLLTLRYAAELHDIGKLKVPSDILLAERPLEPEERATVEQHVVNVQEFLPDEPWVMAALPLIEHHHERWTGGGYPSEASANDIPLSARIIGAAEAFDVMLQGAPWRKPFPEEAAISAMKGLGGNWFDPVVVEVLLKIQPLVQPVSAR